MLSLFCFKNLVLCIQLIILMPPPSFANNIFRRNQQVEKLKIKLKAGFIVSPIPYLLRGMSLILLKWFICGFKYKLKHSFFSKFEYNT